MHSITSRPFKALTLTSAIGGLIALSLMAASVSASPMETTDAHMSESHAHSEHRQSDAKEHRKKPKKHHNMRRVHEVINAYKLERGEISQAEIDAQSQEHQARRAEFKALKEAGDDDALTAKRAAMKAQFKAKHQATRHYVEAHPELKEKLQALRAEHRKDQRGNDHGKMQRMHKIVTDYKLQNGDITQAEVEQQKKQHHAKRQALHDYIEAHPELQTQLREARHSEKKHD